MDEASIKNGMKKMWTDFQSDIQIHVDNWKQCMNAGNEIAIARYEIQLIPILTLFTSYLINFRCTVSQMTASQYFLNEYILTMIVLEKNEALQEYLSGIRSKCGVKSLSEELKIICSTHCTPLNCYQCMAKSMGEDWRHYGMTEMWAQFKPQLEDRFEKWNCDEVAKLPDTDAIKACHAKHSKGVYEILNDCTALMNSMNPKILIDFGMMVQQRCEQICIN